MPKVEFVGQSAKDSSNAAAQSSRLVNFYREPIVSGGLAGYALRSVPGVEPFATLDGVIMRSMWSEAGALWAVCGARLFRVSASGAVTNLRGVANGYASIAANTGIVTVCAGGKYYTVTGDVAAEFDLTEYWPVGSLTYLGGYTVLTEQGGRRFMWSELADPTTLPGLNFASAEQRSDKIIRGLAINDILWLFKESSIEQWYVTGAAGAEAFARVGGAVLEVGLMAHDLIARYQNGAAFIGSDGVFYLAGAGQLQPMSIPAVAAAIRNSLPQSVAYYEARGHKFVAITFRNCPAWVMDLATGEWHERAEGVNLSPWTARQASQMGGRWFVGFNNGSIGRLTDAPTDIGGPLVRMATSRTIYTGKRFRVPLLEFLANVGTVEFSETFMQSVAAVMTRDGAALTNDGAALTWPGSEETTLRQEPTLTLRVSSDGVEFYGDRSAGLGLAGEYAKPIQFRALGQFYRKFAAEIRISSPVEAPILSEAVIEVA